MDEKPRGKPTERAFVVQFRPAEPGRRLRVRGRVEHMDSGRAIQFRSIRELVSFMKASLSIRLID